MKHNQLFSMIKNKKDWTHCKKGKLSAEWGTYEEDDVVYILFRKQMVCLTGFKISHSQNASMGI